MGQRDFVFWPEVGKLLTGCSAPPLLTREGSRQNTHRSDTMAFLHKFWKDEQGQDIAEYAVMLAVILVIVIGTVRLIGTNANTVFSQVASSVQ
jgi:Flp pilus assembly pilin Flp